MKSPPGKPGEASQSAPRLSLEQRLDDLLSRIETAEPGTVDVSMLPKSFRDLAGQKASSQPPAAKPSPASPSAAATKAADQPLPKKAKQPVEPTAEQADMLAALNSALQGIGSKPAPKAPAPPAEAAKVDRGLSMEEKLQREIAALMSGAQPTAAKPPPPAPSDDDDLDALLGSFESPENLVPQTSGVSASQMSATEDQIALEIEGLLNAGQTKAAAPQGSAIDELDKMLAQEIDSDDELAGDFHTVQDITAGIKVQSQESFVVDDEHAATARDVAAELDSQPESLAAMATKPVKRPQAVEIEEDEDPFAILNQISEIAEKNEKEHQQRIRMQMPNWARWLELGKTHLLNACYAINWPARHFLSSEWRANLGYIALLNLFFGVGLWIVLILF